MLRETIRFEWRYHTRQIAFPVGVVIFLALGFTLPVLGYGPGGTNLNAPFVVMQSVGLMSLLTIFVLTVFCANAVARDAEHGMKEIVYATSVGKLRYLTARFAGAFAAAATVFTFTVIGLYLAPLLGKVDPTRLGEPRPLAYLWALLVMALPNLLFAGAVVFAVAVLSRSALASYVASVFLYMLYMVVGMMIGSPLMAGSSPQSPHAMARAALLDPFGISAFFQQTWYWTPAQRNSQLLALDGYFLLNRLLVVALALGILALTYHFFSFRLGARPRSRVAAAAAGSPRRASARYRPVAVSARASWAMLPAALRRELRATATSMPFLALLVLWVIVALIDVFDAGGAEYQTRMYPTTGIMLDGNQTPLAFLATLMVVYFAAEVVWRERIVRSDEIVDATPAANGVFYLAKGGALVLLTWLMALVPMVIGAGYQLSQGYTRLQPGVYLSLLYYTGLPLALLAVVVLLIQTLSPNRYLGILIGMLVVAVMLDPGSLSLSHGLLRFGAPPRAPYTEMNGFLAPQVFGLYMLYWGGLAGVMTLLTIGLWHRGRAQTLPARIRALPLRWGRRGLTGAAACLAIFLVTGGFVFYHTNLLNRYETEEQSLDRMAAYERAFRHYETQPQPVITAVRTAVDLYPSGRRYLVAGAYRLENQSGKAIDTVLVSLRWQLRVARMQLAGGRLVRHDTASGTYVFSLPRPLPPGGVTQLDFRLASPSEAVVADGYSYSVVPNGSYLTRPAAFPRIGYVVGNELVDPGARQQRGLPPPRQGMGLVNDPSRGDMTSGWLTVDATVSTDADQTVLGPGELVRSWRQGQRRYFHYRTPQPTTPVFGFVSARYQVRRVVHHGVAVEVYYDAAHAWNVSKMLAVATRSLDVFGQRFGPYPLRELRIVELPGHWEFGAYALPGMIVWPEDRGFLTDQRQPGEVDLIARRTAHEVSHQWWGHQLYPAQVPGSAALVETLAKYSEMRVLASLHGEASIPPLLRYERQLYMLGRANLPFPEPSISRVVDLEHVYYSKGAIVFEALRDLMGEQALDRALRRLLREHGRGDRPAIAADLLEALHAESAPELHALIDEWVDQVTFYDLRVESVTARPVGGGRYRVSALIRAGKTLLPGGRAEAERAAPLDEMLDVAVYASHPLTSAAAPLSAAKFRLRTGVNQVSFDVVGRPAFLSVDPFERRIEAERADNVREVRMQ